MNLFSTAFSKKFPQVDLQIWYELFFHDCEKKIPGSPANIKNVFNHNNASKDCHHYYDSYNLAELVTMSTLVRLALTMMEEEDRDVSTYIGYETLVQDIFIKVGSCLLDKFKKTDKEHQSRARMYEKKYAEKYSLKQNSEEEEEPAEIETEEVVQEKELLKFSTRERLEALTKEKEAVTMMMAAEEQVSEYANEELRRIFEEEQHLAETLERLEADEVNVATELCDEELESRLGEDSVS